MATFNCEERIVEFLISEIVIIFNSGVYKEYLEFLFPLLLFVLNYYFLLLLLRVLLLLRRL